MSVFTASVGIGQRSTAIKAASISASPVNFHHMLSIGRRGGLSLNPLYDITVTPLPRSRTPADCGRIAGGFAVSPVSGRIGIALLRRAGMSNRTYTIVLSIAVAALIGVLFASYILHRLTLSPLSIGLLVLLIVIPASNAIFLLPAASIFRRIAPPELLERMRDRRARDPLPAYAVWTCVASLGASFALLAAGALLIPASAPSNTIFM